ncbi:glutathione S-transferase family protein [Coralloluteibacterium stylophorae]|uniref:Glutathione S-transferase family protein n=1 Tax=Coralloluteibacterium stylophorae TaxID=1776034 RepID=A0A8J7VSZ7_9GAMM|nr:glutathione S-transferase family protein [Coralloluteibacterium stylophorae]MBS7456813.1 glutathione S-transferase family protein [Coralloluteibacterium stylophorae]
MELYFNPRSRATISKWLLDEAGADYTLVPVDFETRQHKTPEFLAINPAGKLPALVDGGQRLFESAAIALYIADRHPAANLAPAPDSPDRGRYLSLVVYATAQLEPAMGDALLGAETSSSRGWTDYATARGVIERELGDGPWLFGDQFTAADILIGSIFIWKRMFGGDSDGARIDAYVDRLLARPHALRTG